MNGSKRVERVEDDGRSGHVEKHRSEECCLFSQGQTFIQPYYLGIFMKLDDSVHRKSLKFGPTVS
jgi:hypothetical protein